MSDFERCSAIERIFNITSENHICDGDLNEPAVVQQIHFTEKVPNEPVDQKLLVTCPETLQIGNIQENDMSVSRNVHKTWQIARNTI